MIYGVFEVDEDGNVYRNGRCLKPELVSGYKRINTRVCGQGFKFLVHRAVAECFIPNPDNKPCVNHKDGNKANNSVENLEWCTRSENSIHSYRTGLQSARKGKDSNLSKLDQAGEKNHQCKLTDVQVQEIKDKWETGMTQTNLSKTYGVGQAQISRIVTGKRRNN